MPVKGITLFIFGGVSEMEDEPPTALSEFFMAVVGPLSSLAIAGLCGSVWVLGNFVFAFPSTVNVLFGYLAIVNCMLAIFNSLPAFPLDGGRVVRSILWGITGNLWSATRVASTIGSAFGMAMIVGGIFMLFNGVLIGGIWLVFIGFFLRQAASGSLNQIVMRRALGGERVGHFMTSGPTCVTPDMTLQKFVDDYVLPYHYNLFPVVDESKRLVGAIRALDPSTVDQEKWDSTRIEELMRRDIDGILIDPNTPAMDALKRLRDEQGRRLIVVEEGRPVGILSLRDLLDFLEIKMDLSGLPRH
jgi:CBS domain-containing protein